MPQTKNFYVIVDRTGTQPVTCWAPAASPSKLRASQAAGSHKLTNLILKDQDVIPDVEA